HRDGHRWRRFRKRFGRRDRPARARVGENHADSDGTGHGRRRELDEIPRRRRGLRGLRIPLLADLVARGWWRHAQQHWSDRTPMGPDTVAAGSSMRFLAAGADSAGYAFLFSPTWSLVAGGGTLNSTGPIGLRWDRTRSPPGAR